MKHPLHSFCIKPEIFQAFSVKFEIQSQMELHVKTKYKKQSTTGIKLENNNKKQEKRTQRKNTQAHEKSHQYGISTGLPMAATEEGPVVEVGCKCKLSHFLVYRPQES